MANTVVFVFSISLLWANAFKNPNFIFDTKIENGKRATVEQFPYAAIISTYSNDEKSLTGHCLSPLISNTWILTHAKCADYPTTHYAVVGRFIHGQLSDMMNVIEVRRMISSAWQFVERRSDSLVLLELNKTVSDIGLIKPAAILRNIQHDIEVTIVGIDMNLMEAHHFKTPLINHRFCREKIKEACIIDYELDNRHFCTDEPHGTNSSTNDYDIGAPVVVREGVIVGIVKSTGDEHIPGCPGVNVNIAHYEEFINKYVSDVKWVDE